MKEIQRSDPSGKEQWDAYTDQFGHGVRDPSKHDNEFLVEFLTSLRNGVRYEPKNTLADLLKEGQRKSAAWKRCWSAYCQQFGNGLNDPLKHDAAFCSGFLEFLATAGCGALQSGMILVQPSLKRMSPGAPLPGALAMPGATAKDQLVMAVKGFQRQGPEKKELWGAFCDAHAGGTRDPSRHEQSSLEMFLSQHSILPVSPTVGMCMSPLGNPYGVAMADGPPLKRMNLGGGMAATTSTGSRSKDQLVAAVKAFQRQGETQKELWAAHCDSHHAGTRDPSRHDTSTLETFLSEHDSLPEDDDDGESFTAASSPASMSLGAQPVAVSANGRTKSQLVASVKAFQRLGQEQKEIWGAYCDTSHGGTRDPNAHDVAVLEEFLNDHANGLVTFEENGKASVSTGDSEKDALVAKIKAYQRGGEEQKETWGAYADENSNGMRDPARLDVSLLQHFVDSYAL